MFILTDSDTHHLEPPQKLIPQALCCFYQILISSSIQDLLLFKIHLPVPHWAPV